MQLLIVKGEPEFGQTAARLVCEFLAQKPESTLVFPTGNTPLSMYKELVKQFKAGAVNFSHSTLVELDDYYGIPLHDPRNLFSWLQNVFIRQVNFRPEQLFRFNTEAEDAAAEAARMESIVLAKGGIDLLVLGLGPNGHIGFNEPGSESSGSTRVVNLTHESLISNARYWGGISNVPVQGFTLGLDVLRKAAKTILLVSGSHKAGILKQTVEGPITDLLPATCLREMPNVLILADAAAATLLSHKSSINEFD